MIYKPYIFLFFSIWLILFNSGCATRSIQFSSEPAGAIVKVDSKQCTTPCTMEVDYASRQASIQYNYKETKLVDIPKCTTSEIVKNEILSKTEITLKTLTIPLGIVGFAGSYVIINDSKNDRSTDNDTVNITAFSLTAAVICYLGGDLFENLKENSGIQIYVEFASKNTSNVETDYIGDKNSVNLKESGLQSSKIEFF